VRAVRAALLRFLGLLRFLFRGSAEPPGGFVEIAIDDSIAALDEIEHVVVLMLENRSFDHLLGYLSLEPFGSDVDGLERGMANTYEGRSHPIFRLSETALEKAQDPCHSGACVDEQVADANGGFAANYIRTREDPEFAGPVVVMGYYDGDQLPVYDFLARRFCVCDRWFCPVRGATFPNRLYAVAGRAAGSRDNASPPVYHFPSFVRHLDAARATWRWYTHEIFATIWAVDRDYLPKTFDNVRPFSSPFSFDDFFSAAQAGTLPNVAWIDPNFVDVGGPVGSNDDHPPSDVRAGQELVLRVFNALVRGPAWSTAASSTMSRHRPLPMTMRVPSSTPMGRGCPPSSSLHAWALVFPTRSSTTHRSSRPALPASAGGTRRSFPTWVRGSAQRTISESSSTGR
jgi:phospholipase C